MIPEAPLPPARFDAITRMLHWSVATLILVLVALGAYMVTLNYYDRWYNASLSWHKSLGMLALGLALLKLGWKAGAVSPAPLVTLALWERRAAKIMHGLLLVLMVLVPASGYLISTSAGQGVDLFGWFAIPALIQGGPALRDAAIIVHFYASYGMAALVVGHAGAALKHHFLNRDATLRRMI